MDSKLKKCYESREEMKIFSIRMKEIREYIRNIKSKMKEDDRKLLKEQFNRSEENLEMVRFLIRKEED